MMDPAEVDVICCFLRPGTVMFEFGSGGSTVAFSSRVQRLYSAEHCPQWSHMVSDMCKAAGASNVQLLYAEPNLQALDALGVTAVGITEPQILIEDSELNPAENPNITCGPNMDPIWRNATPQQRTEVLGDYVGLIAKAGEARFDVVLVDGRCRGECAIAALPFVDESSVVIIHDWFLEEIVPPSCPQFKPTADSWKLPPRRSLPSYKRVLEHYDVLAEVSPTAHPERCARAGLVVLRKKSSSAKVG